MKPYRMLDLEYLGCSNPIVGKFDTLEDYEKDCKYMIERRCPHGRRTFVYAV